MSKCNFHKAIKSIKAELAKKYSGDELANVVLDSIHELIDSNPEKVPLKDILEFVPDVTMDMGNKNIAKIREYETKGKMDKAGIMKKYLWDEGHGRDLNGYFRGKFYYKQERESNAAEANSSLLGSGEDVSWTKKPFGPDDSVSVQKLTEHFREVFDDLNEYTMDDGHYQALNKTFDNTAQMFIDAGVEVNYTFVERVNGGNEHNEGSANIEKDEIQMRYGINTDFFTPAEIMLHEMQHLLVEKTLRASPEMKRKIKRLRKALLKDPKINYKIFLTDKPNASQEQVDFAKRQFDYVFKHPDNAEGEFLVSATTNRYVMEAMDLSAPAINLMDKYDVAKKRSNNLALGKGNSRGETASTRFMKVANALIDLINETYRNAIGVSGKSSKTVAEELLIELTKSAVASERETKVKTASDNRFVRGFFAAEQKMSSLLKRLDKEYEDIDKYGARIRKKEGMAGFIEKVTNHRKLVQFKNDIIINGWLGSLLRDTTAPDSAWFYEMFRVAKKDLDIRVNEVKNSILHTFNRKFGWEDIDKNDGLRRVATNMLLRTDLGAIGGVQELKNYLDDPKMLDKHIKTLESGLNDNIRAAAERLAYKLMTGKEIGVNGHKNAWEIELEFRDAGEGHSEARAKKIDSLVTLRAIKFAGEEDKKVMKEALKDPKKFKMMQLSLNLYNTRIEQSLKTFYNNKHINTEKGQFQEHFDERKITSIASEDDLPGLAKLKIFPVNDGKPLEALTHITGKKYYMVTGPDLESGYSKGLISTVGLGSKGDSLKAILYKIGYGIDEVDEIVKELTTFKAGTNVVFDGSHNMTPERNEYGVIEDYSFRPTVEEQYKYMDMKNDIVHVLANTVSNMTNKETSVYSNIKAVNYMNAFYHDNKEDFGHEFVKVRPSTKKELDAGKPYKYAYLWDAMPSYTQQHAKRTNGNVEVIYVHRSMVQNFFGFKDASIAEAPILNNRHASKVSMKVVEDVLFAFVNRFKRVVVTLLPDTIYDNLVSNATTVMQLTHMGPNEYAKAFRESWMALDDYNENRRKMAIMDTERDSGVKVDEALYESLAGENAANMVHDLFEDGQITQILEDLELSSNDSQSFTSKKIDKVFGALPDSVREFKEQLYLDPKTTSYEKIAKLTQYGDAVNRVIIYNALKDKEPKRALLNRLDQLFVNYNYLDNKYIKWVGDAGFLLFFKYTTRMLPVIWKIAKSNPLTTALYQGGQSLANIDIVDIFDSYYSPLSTILNKAALFDPKNMFEAVFTPAPIYAFTN